MTEAGKERSRIKALLNSIRRLLGSRPTTPPGDPRPTSERLCVAAQKAAAVRLPQKLRTTRFRVFFSDDNEIHFPHCLGISMVNFFLNVA
jgi:hypothetical protein